MSDFSVERLRALADSLGTLPISENWMYSAIRHCQRNMDFDCENGRNEPDRQSGAYFAQLANMLPAILAMAEENARLREALEWYGEQARLCRLIHSEGDSGRHALSADGGKLAARALGRTKPMLKDEKVREALEPCPFCGGTDGFVERADYSDCYVICNDCGARGPTSCDENDDDAQASESGECEPGERPARRLWNTRTPPDQAEASTLPGEVVEDLTDIQKAAIRSSIFLGGQWVLTTQYEDHPEIQEGLSEDLADCVSGILTTLGEAVRARLLYATSPTTPMVPGDFREWLQFSLSQARYNNDALDLKAAEIISNVLARYDAAAPPTTPAVEVVPKCPFCGEQPIPDATEEGHVEHPDFGNDCALTDSLIRPDQWRRRAALPAVESGAGARCYTVEGDIDQRKAALLSKPAPPAQAEASTLPGEVVAPSLAELEAEAQIAAEEYGREQMGIWAVKLLERSLKVLPEGKSLLFDDIKLFLSYAATPPTTPAVESESADRGVERIARLEAALQPFADCCDQISPYESDEEWAKFRLLVKNYRDAYDAINGETT